MKPPVLALLLVALMIPALARAGDCVILLHGLARTADSMRVLQARLQQAGYQVINIDYESRKYPIEVLAEQVVNRGLAGCRQAGTDKIHFVTHSLGGILVRHYLNDHNIESLHRVVMLGPPNQGSEVIDKLRDMPGFEAFHGPAGLQLGTGENSVPRQLGPVDYETGIIAGTQSINLILSLYLPGDDDGKVSVDKTRVAGMTDFIALPATHPLMMRDEEVIRQTLHFLAQGRFSRE